MLYIHELHSLAELPHALTAVQLLTALPGLLGAEIGAGGHSSIEFGGGCLLGYAPLVLDRQKLRKAALSVALAAFALGLVIAAKNVPDGLHIRPGLLVGYALLLPPLNYLVQTAELRLTVRAGGRTIGWKQALEVVIYSRAATLLPIPGGMLTRIAALKAKGVSTVRSSLIVLLFTGLLGTVAFAYAGAWLSPSPMGTGFLAVSAIGAIICTVIARRAAVPLSLIGQGLALRGYSVILETVGLMWAFAVIGANVRFDQTAVMVVAGFIGMAVNIVPSGIGIREGVIAFLSTFVGINPATGFLAAAFGRVVGYTWMVGISGWMLLRKSK